MANVKLAMEYAASLDRETLIKKMHVVPVNDLREHITDEKCWCNPNVNDDLVVVHNSMDQRETYEEGRKTQ